jgi:hypothetical protein
LSPTSRRAFLRHASLAGRTAGFATVRFSEKRRLEADAEEVGST